MTTPDFSIEFVREQSRLIRLVDRLCSVSVVAVDIETADWWNRFQERVALVQIAYRVDQKAKVAVIDTLANLNLEPLRRPLELGTITKAIHNAGFDATRLAKHFKFQVTPIHDTMSAARRNGERRYSLQAQAEAHLGIHLDKGGQRSDWSRRPLDARQIHYAALDAISTLLLYENQVNRKLSGTYQLKTGTDSSQAMLPLEDSLDQVGSTLPLDINTLIREKEYSIETGFSLAEIVLIGIITELPTRYHPDQLAVSVGSERVGLTGWIVDRFMGRDADLDEESAKLALASLYERKLVRITTTRRLEATDKGKQIWQQLKSKSH